MDEIKKKLMEEYTTLQMKIFEMELRELLVKYKIELAAWDTETKDPYEIITCKIIFGKMKKFMR